MITRQELIEIHSGVSSARRDIKLCNYGTALKRLQFVFDQLMVLDKKLELDEKLKQKPS